MDHSVQEVLDSLEPLAAQVDQEDQEEVGEELEAAAADQTIQRALALDLTLARCPHHSKTLHYRRF